MISIETRDSVEVERFYARPTISEMEVEMYHLTPHFEIVVLTRCQMMELIPGARYILNLLFL